MKPGLDLDGKSLTLEQIEAVAFRRATVRLSPQAMAGLARGRAVVEAALAAEEPVYGLTTGLGARVGHRLSEEDLAAFSLRTVQGRAQALGQELDAPTVRATMLLQLNGRISGGAGLSPAIARLLSQMLNRDLRPALPSIGSLGAGDLCILGHLGRFVAGEGQGWLGDRPGAAEMLFQEAKLTPAVLGPKDGLALINASSAATAVSVLALRGLMRLYAVAQVAAALSLEAFRGNLSPFGRAANAARPQPGQMQAAAEIRRLLRGSLLKDPGQSRRLQDPISLRCLAPLHGSLATALDFAAAAVTAEINAAGDNPLILVEEERIVSTGNFLTPHLTLSLDTLARAAAQTAGASLSRTSRLMTKRFSDLPDNLSRHDQGRSGFAPLMKIGDALLGEITHLAQPVQPVMRWGADGVEDEVTHSALAATKLGTLAERMGYLLAIELAVATEALEQRDLAKTAPRMREVSRLVRNCVAPLDDDRSFSDEISALASGPVADGALAAVLLTASKARPGKQAENGPPK